jgi:Flp pilus assembly protein TadD
VISSVYGRSVLLAFSLAVAGCATGLDQDAAGGQLARPVLSSSGQADVNLRLARATRAAGDFTSAVQLFRDLVTDRSATPQLLLEAGDCMVEAGFFDEAIVTYSRVQDGSARPDALRGVVRAQMALGPPAAALPFADEALALSPQDARALVNRGAVLDALQRHAEAQAAYRSALEINPRSVAARNNLALSLALTGQYQEAIGIMSPLARSASATPKVRENMALIFGLSGNTAQAAAASRSDLDEGQTAQNLEFYARVRETVP